MNPIRLYWWNLRRSPKALAAELVYKPRSWIRAVATSRELFLNFGDEMSREIVEAAFGRKVVWSTAEKADLVAIGSVLERMERPGAPISVWGSGLRSGALPEEAVNREMRFLAVRGNLTADRLGINGQVPMGDPGLLAKEVFGDPVKNHDIVYVPHFSELAQWSRLTQFCDGVGARLVLPTAKPQNVVREIGSARVVFSASLHGIIVADSYGVPVVPLLPFSDAESPFKYHDYMGVVGAQTELQVHDDLQSASDHERELLIGFCTEAAELRGPTVAEAKEGLLAAARSY